MTAFLADSRQQFSPGRREQSLGADSRREDDLSDMILCDLSDDRCLSGILVRVKCSQDCLCALMGHKHDKPPLAGQIERLQSEHATYTLDRRGNGNGVRIQFHPDLALGGDFVKDRAHTSPRGIAYHMDVLCGIKGSLDSAPEGCAVTGDICRDIEVVAGQEDGAAVPSDVPSDDDIITGLCVGAMGMDIRQRFPDAGGGDEDVVHLPFARNLRIPHDDADTSLSGGLFHGSNDLPKVFHGKTFFNDKGAGKVFRPCPHTGEVIDRAADAELADIAAGEFPGGDNEAVGGEGDFPVVDGKKRGIVCRELRIVEMAYKDILYEFAGPTASRTMGKGDVFLQEMSSLCSLTLITTMITYTLKNTPSDVENQGFYFYKIM